MAVLEVAEGKPVESVGGGVAFLAAEENPTPLGEW